jgi:hypothetical protein
MNEVRNRELLDDKLEFFIGQHGTSHFLQDGASCYWSKIVSAWFEQRPHISQLSDAATPPTSTPSRLTGHG